ncbi:MAG: hypothetical protein AAFN70_02105 [Planctomycetota bacterium]
MSGIDKAFVSAYNRQRTANAAENSNVDINVADDAQETARLIIDAQSNIPAPHDVQRIRAPQPVRTPALQAAVESETHAEISSPAAGDSVKDSKGDATTDIDRTYGTPIDVGVNPSRLFLQPVVEEIQPVPEPKSSETSPVPVIVHRVDAGQGTAPPTPKQKPSAPPRTDTTAPVPQVAADASQPMTVLPETPPPVPTPQPSESDGPADTANRPATSATPIDRSSQRSAQRQAETQLKQRLRPEPLQPAWQVPKFDLPGHVDELFMDSPLLHQIGNPLSDAAKGGMRCVLVTSAFRGEGRTTVTIGIALAAAASGMRVGIIDADTRQDVDPDDDNGSLADCLNLDLEMGWNDAITQNLPLDECCVHSQSDGVTLLPLLPPKPDSIANGAQLQTTIEQLKYQFDLLLIDTAALSQSGNALLPQRWVDAAIIVRDTRVTNDLADQNAIAMLRSRGIAGIGHVAAFERTTL